MGTQGNQREKRTHTTTNNPIETPEIPKQKKQPITTPLSNQSNKSQIILQTQFQKKIPIP
jgi:hypothetical protein